MTPVIWIYLDNKNYRSFASFFVSLEYTVLKFSWNHCSISSNLENLRTQILESIIFWEWIKIGLENYGSWIKIPCDAIFNVSFSLLS